MRRTLTTDHRNVNPRNTWKNPFTTSDPTIPRLNTDPGIIRVEYGLAGRELHVPSGHRQRVGDQLDAHVVGHRVPDDLLAEAMAHGLVVVQVPPPGQLRVDPAVPAGAVRVLEREPHPGVQQLAPHVGRRRRPVPPLVVPGAGHPGPTAHLDHRVIAFFASDERVLRVHRCFFAKKATDFPRNSFSIFSSRFSRSNSRNRARSETDSSGSSPACASRYAFTQFPKVCSTTPKLRATSATVREFSMTSRTAASLNSGEYLPR